VPGSSARSTLDFTSPHRSTPARMHESRGPSAQLVETVPLQAGAPWRIKSASSGAGREIGLRGVCSCRLGREISEDGSRRGAPTWCRCVSIVASRIHGLCHVQDVVGAVARAEGVAIVGVLVSATAIFGGPCELPSLEKAGLAWVRGSTF